MNTIIVIYIYIYIYIYISPFEIWWLLMFCISIWEIKHVLLPLTCVNICKDQRELPFCVCLLPKFLFIIQMFFDCGWKEARVVDHQKIYSIDIMWIRVNTLSNFQPSCNRMVEKMSNVINPYNFIFNVGD